MPTSVQSFRRVPDREGTIRIDFIESVDPEIIRLTRFDTSRLVFTPIGGVVISTLDYYTFLEVNKDPNRVGQVGRSTGAPCDGHRYNRIECASYFS